MADKNKSNKFASIGILVVSLALLYTVLIVISDNQPETPPTFTTNIDLIHKTVNDTQGDTAESDTGTLGTARNFLDRGERWLTQNFNIWKFYQNLANPYSRYIVLNSGLRKEEVADVLTKELNWSDGEKYAFLTADQLVSKRNMEGYYSPGDYLVPATTEPLEAYQTIIGRFNQDVGRRYATATAEIINMNLAVKIASIIEREAAGKRDMRLISGIIWNRIFKDMNLEMDSTLQYAKGSSRNGWWPKVGAADKFIDSPYNTYMNKGLPPTPISNVSIAAVQAALNPGKTGCLFYLHDRYGRIHCSVTYKEHQRNIKKFL